MLSDFVEQIGQIVIEKIAKVILACEFFAQQITIGNESWDDANKLVFDVAVNEWFDCQNKVTTSRCTIRIEVFQQLIDSRYQLLGVFFQNNQSTLWIVLLLKRGLECFNVYKMSYSDLDTLGNVG